MQYLMLVRVDGQADPTPEESDPTRWVEDTTKRGVRRFGERLRPDADATTVRVRDRKTLVTDGPFVEVREQIAGFDLIEVDSPEEAVAVAAAHPAARFGAIELRELWAFPEDA